MARIKKKDLTLEEAIILAVCCIGISMSLALAGRLLIQGVM